MLYPPRLCAPLFSVCALVPIRLPPAFSIVVPSTFLNMTLNFFVSDQFRARIMPVDMVCALTLL